MAFKTSSHPLRQQSRQRTRSERLQSKHKTNTCAHPPQASKQTQAYRPHPRPFRKTRTCAYQTPSTSISTWRPTHKSSQAAGSSTCSPTSSILIPVRLLQRVAGFLRRDGPVVYAARWRPSGLAKNDSLTRVCRSCLPLLLLRRVLRASAGRGELAQRDGSRGRLLVPAARQCGRCVGRWRRPCVHAGPVCVCVCVCACVRALVCSRAPCHESAHQRTCGSVCFASGCLPGQLGLRTRLRRNLCSRDRSQRACA